MKILKYLLLGLLLLASIKGFCCDCHGNVTLADMQKRDYEYADLIFVGDLMDVDRDQGTYEFEVVEIFKGKYKQKTIKGKYQTSCSGVPDKGRWIIYANFIGDGVIDFSTCGLSRSFHEPHFSWAKEHQIPPPKKADWERSKKDSEFSIQNQIDIEREIMKLKEKALSDLENEINELREKRGKPVHNPKN